MTYDPVAAVDAAINETLEMIQTVKEKQLKRTKNLLSKHRTRHAVALLSLPRRTVLTGVNVPLSFM